MGSRSPATRTSCARWPPRSPMTTPDRKKPAYTFALEQEKRGDLQAAAQAFLRAGAPEEAARVLAAQGRFGEAGQALLGAIPYQRQRTASLSAPQRTGALKAAIWFARGGDVPKAVELFVMLGERARAVELLRGVGDHANAARIEADPSHQGTLMGYPGAGAPTGERPGEASLPGAMALEAAGKLEAALEAFLQLR